VGTACSRIAAWAEEKGSRRTQLEFQQAAALCCPANPWFALAVGVTSRDLASYSRAEAWFFRTIGLARRNTDWDAYVKGYLSLGIMMFRRGALPAARRSYLKALRRSRRQSFRDGEARALHNLSAVEYRTGSFAKAIDLTGQALEAYGPTHEDLPRLAHDVAYYWLQQGACEHALSVFLETLGRVKVGERPTVLGSIARAAVGNGDRAAYRWAKQELLRSNSGPGMAEAWVDVARAALALDLRDEALEAAQLAEEVARSRREGQMRFLAESVMNEIESERTLAAERPATESPVFDLATSDELARKLIRTLQLTPAGQLVAAGA
jgi:tetratricopeptide (TPR) repeat protein